MIQDEILYVINIRSSEGAERHVDVTIVNPTAPSNLVHAQRMLGAATEAEKRKIRKYDELSSQQNYTFIPFVIETYGGI